MIDSHAHLDFDDFDPDRAEVLARARSAGVLGIVNVGFDLASSRKSLELARDNKGFVFAAAGFHPHDSKGMDENSYEELKWLGAESEVKAIGEIGLDYYKEYSPRDVQVRAFRKQIELAEYFEKPLIIHSRQALEDTLRIIRDYRKTAPVRGVFHCFSGDVGVAHEVLDLGFHIGIGGPVTFKNAKKLVDVVRYAPLDSILLETDAPFLAPHPHRGKRNEPAYIPIIAEKVAELKRTSLEELDRRTSLSATRLFGLDKPEPVYAYVLGGNCYLNITNRCTNECVFCYGRVRRNIGPYDLTLEREPTCEEIVVQVGDASAYDEIVFCGYGEPLLRPRVVARTAELLRARGARRVRIDTNGLAEAYLGEEILPVLKGLVDAVSISLNAPDAATYKRLCPSAVGDGAFDEVLKFIRRAKRFIPEVWATVVDVDGVDVEECERLARELGVRFRVRHYSEPQR